MKKEFNGWQRLWVLASLLLFFCIFWFAFDRPVADFLWNLFLVIAIWLIAISVIYFFGYLISWVLKGFKISVVTFEFKPIAYILLVFLLSVVFYYLVSPYQNCIRDKLDKGFCSRNKTW